MSERKENYRLTPYGLLSMRVGEKTAKRCLNELELHLRRHYGPVGALVVDTEKGDVTFARLEKAAEGKA